DRFVARRRELVGLYAERLAPLAPRIQLAASPRWSRAAPHLLAVLIDFAGAGLSRRQVWDRLRASGVGAQVHYIPVHTQPYYRRLNPTLRLPGAEAWYGAELSLPLFPAMTDGDVDHVVTALGEALTA
ncbi:MAG: DegT/DnrJ/EryC1/StrS aminotransferase, partial [Caulobacteraceae bacterium]|nr:DegT/DnrJ/EryC1/StrS aminotransferase [Caulobacteraceae bacterium]